MKQVAKLVIINKDDEYLLLYRDQHPTFGNDPDLPGGTLEDNELPVETMVREVYEEVGVALDKGQAQQVYEGVGYSAHNTHYSLYLTKLKSRPSITLSWEHASYEWLARAEFLEKAKHANDTYMHMVYDVLK